MISGKRSKKDITYVRLVDVLSSPGCPICAILEKVERDAIFSLLYERVNDPGSRKAFIRSLGFCPYHAWLLADIARSEAVLGGLGPAVLYEHALRKYLEEEMEGPEGECYLCSWVEEFEKIYVEAFVRPSKSLDLLDRYENSEAILCDRHFKEIYERLGSKERERLKEIQRRKIEKVLEKVRSYIDKHDYRNEEPITREEANSWKIAIEILKGKRVEPILRAYFLGVKKKRRGS